VDFLEGPGVPHEHGARLSLVALIAKFPTGNSLSLIRVQLQSLLSTRRRSKITIALASSACLLTSSK
jgi:hypothetical protein